MNAIAFLFCLVARQDETVAETIRRLGDDRVEVREAAQEKLKARGRAVLSDLERAAKVDPDPEIRARVLLVIKSLTQVRWHTDLSFALKKASLEKRPLLVFSTMGPLDGYA